jgi:hypothetical protein
VEYLISLSEISRIDELDCTKSWCRQVSDKDLDYVLPILTDDNTLKAGLKIDYKPKFKHSDWNSWKEGFIEGFVRFSRDPEYFIWTYIKMDKLESILEKFKDNLVDYRKYE